MAEELTKQQIEEFKEVFCLYDDLGEGLISVKYLHNALKTLGQNPSQNEMQNIIKNLGTDLNGEINFDQFVQLMCNQIKSSETDQELEDAFKIFDTDNSGNISHGELTHILKTLGQEMSDKDILEMIQAIDTDNDGEISLQDFKRMMRNT